TVPSNRWRKNWASTRCPMRDATPSDDADARNQARHLVEQLEGDQHARWQRGERVSVEVYLERHPTLRDDPEGVVDLIYHEFLLRQQTGEAPPLEEYLGRFPHLSQRLRDQWEVHEAVLSGRAFTDGTVARESRSTSDPSPSTADAADLPTVPGY